MCEAGTFQDEMGQETCKSCAEGSFQDEEGRTTCSLCSDGEFQDETGQTSCEPCPPGRFQDEQGQDTCSVCPSGTFSDSVGASACMAWTQCQQGERQVVMPSVDQDRVCGECPAGTVQPFSGLSGCDPCGAGSFQDETGQETCKLCSDGTFQDETSQTSCKDCGVGMFQDQGGQTSCEVCPLNQFQDEAGQPRCKSCSECETGFFRAGGCTTDSDRRCSRCLIRDDCASNQFLSGICDSTSTSGPVCSSCDSSCLTCNGPNPLPCATCPAGFDVLEDGTCGQGCASDEYFDENAQTCRPCDSTCRTCNGPGPAQCSSCENPSTRTTLPLAQHRYLLNDRCTLDCSLELGFYKGDTNGICWPCTTCVAGQRENFPCMEFTVRFTSSHLLISYFRMLGAKIVARG